MIAFVTETGLQEVPADGGQAKQLTKLAPGGSVTHAWPCIVPTADALLFSILDWSQGLQGAKVAAVSRRTGEVRTLVEGPATDVAPVDAYALAWSADGRVVYFVGRDPRDQSVGIWSVPAAGGAPRLTVRFDDPSRPRHHFGFRVHGGRFYFTVGDRQSDVWTTELTGAR